MSAVDDRMSAMTEPSPALVLAERAVPRYTSYPTAPQFSGAVDEAVARRWLAGLDAEAALSIYLHVPFCRTICNYCGCSTKATRKDEPVVAYAELLAREMELASSVTPARRVRHIHWGGGTPSILGPDLLRRLGSDLSRRFQIDSDAEHAIELDPRLVDRRLAEALAEIGVTRVSFGVQDLNPQVQKAIGRIQPFDVVARATEAIRDAGIEAINFDLMYGLPLQSLKDVENTARLAASLAPSRLAVFGYAHVPWFKANQKLIVTETLPGAAERIQQAAASRGVLEGEGYVAIGLDHMARPDDPLAVAARGGSLRRNFQGYTTDTADALLGFGASAIGFPGRGFVQNVPDTAGWSRAVADGRLPVVRGIAMSAEDHLRSRVIERLMCDFEVDFGSEAERCFGRADVLDGALPTLVDLVEQGVVEVDGRIVRVLPHARDLVRLAAAAFDAYLPRSQARHSVAV
jgi:oxygen-independent coproporphyrinogen-3 oxidase